MPEATAKQFQELSELLGISKEELLPSKNEDVSSDSTTSTSVKENTAACSSVVSESDSNENINDSKWIWHWSIDIGPYITHPYFSYTPTG